MIPCRTFSIVAADPVAGECGVAVASKFLSVGAVVPWARGGVGAIATQSYANTSYGPIGLDLLAKGLTPQAAVDRLTAADPYSAKRQVGVVDMAGRAATFSGQECFPWFGGLTGDHVAVQGNILVGEATVTAMLQAFQTTTGPLADRLLAALKAGDRAGGDRRGKQSAALLVVKPAGGYGGLNDRYLDLRIDDHPHPVDELERLTLGYEPGRDGQAWDEGDRKAFTAFSEMENLEDRLRVDGRTDRQVLAYFREKLTSYSAPPVGEGQGGGSA
ncbi:MAG: DUF1028 domain-containing protein [Chloroflexota bacterium]|nr:MAG: DUF1028 domain-containing protein [Chloroflexota bacterium]